MNKIDIDKLDAEERAEWAEYARDLRREKRAAKMKNLQQELPALHPDRVRSTLRLLRQGIDHCGMVRELSENETQTCIAALDLVRKAQQAAGITSNVADAGAALVKLMGALRK